MFDLLGKEKSAGPNLFTMWSDLHKEAWWENVLKLLKCYSIQVNFSYKLKWIIKRINIVYITIVHYSPQMVWPFEPCSLIKTDLVSESFLVVMKYTISYHQY